MPTTMNPRVGQACACPKISTGTAEAGREGIPKGVEVVGGGRRSRLLGAYDVSFQVGEGALETQDRSLEEADQVVALQ